MTSRGSREDAAGGGRRRVVVAGRRRRPVPVGRVEARVAAAERAALPASDAWENVTIITSVLPTKRVQFRYPKDPFSRPFQ